VTPPISELWAPVLQIIWIDLVLSGDNAVVIALACRQLAGKQRFWGIIFGTAAAIALRVALTFVVVEILHLPFVRLIGGLLLLWIAVSLVLEEEEEKGRDVPAATSTFTAIRIIVIADAIMSLDNVMAIAAAAKGSLMLVVFGLTLSVPLIIFSASMFLALLSRFPILIWLGAAVLGYVAGELVGSEHLLDRFAIAHGSHWEIASGIVGIIATLAISLMVKQLRRHPKID
jgi:YjbE family integral membrane protein